jgi:hypothetical protein
LNEEPVERNCGAKIALAISHFSRSWDAKTGCYVHTKPSLRRVGGCPSAPPSQYRFRVWLAPKRLFHYRPEMDIRVVAPDQCCSWGRPHTIVRPRLG